MILLRKTRLPIRFSRKLDPKCIGLFFLSLKDMVPMPTKLIFHLPTRSHQLSMFLMSFLTMLLKSSSLLPKLWTRFFKEGIDVACVPLGLFLCFSRILVFFIFLIF